MDPMDPIASAHSALGSFLLITVNIDHMQYVIVVIVPMIAGSSCSSISTIYNSTIIFAINRFFACQPVRIFFLYGMYGKPLSFLNFTAKDNYYSRSKGNTYRRDTNS